jgi:hypothetical protein
MEYILLCLAMPSNLHAWHTKPEKSEVSDKILAIESQYIPQTILEASKRVGMA